jgi:F-type H+-transporting ATPase subunit b
MQEILQQLGQLALGAIPTVIIFITLVLAYRFLVYGPLMKVLAERRARTVGAVEKASAAIGAADAKAQEYEARLRAARADIYRAREARVQQWNAERDAVLNSAREAAQDRVSSAKTAIDAQTSDARHQIEAAADQLAAQILKAILPGNAASLESSR